MPWIVLLLLFLAPYASAQEARRADPAVPLQVAPRPPVPEDWESVAGPSAQLYGPPALLPTLLRLSREVERAVPHLVEALELPLTSTIHVYVVDDDRRFRQLQPTAAPSWADAVAYPSQNLILLRSPSLRGTATTPLETVLRHELVHVLLGRAFAPNRPPTWLQEGLAQLHAGEIGPSTTAILAEGLATGRLSTLDGLAAGFPDDPVRARIAYAQSASFLQFIEQTYGTDALAVLVREMARGSTFEGALHLATGDFLPTIEQRWRRRLAGSGLGWTVLGNPDLWLGAGALLLVVGGFARRRRFHRRLREMEEEERALDALLGETLAAWRP